MGRIQPLESLRIKDDQGNDFEDGRSRTFVPPKGYAGINLTDGIPQPKAVFVSFALAEMDSGGFAEFLNELYSHVRDKVIEEFAKLGWEVGSIGGPLGSVVGAIVGATIGLAVRDVVQWIIDAWKDDVFPLRLFSITVDGFLPEDSLPDGFPEPDPVHFFGHDGHYMLWLNDRLVAEQVS